VTYAFRTRASEILIEFLCSIEVGCSWLASIYDAYWKGLLDKVQKLLEEANKRGRSQEIDVSDLTRIGRRSAWNGTVIVSKLMTKSAMAHTTSLGNVVIESGILNNFEKATFRLTVSKSLKLHAEMLSNVNNVTLMPKVTVAQREETPELILQTEDYGLFYQLIRDFEVEIRSFIVEMLGKGWIKRLENDAPDLVEKWKQRCNNDSEWGIVPEENLINYADLTDYMQIIKKYRKIFSKSDEELGLVIANFNIFANRGRNPVMHFRTLTQEGYYAAKAAERFLRKWVERRISAKGLKVQANLMRASSDS